MNSPFAEKIKAAVEEIMNKSYWLQSRGLTDGAGVQIVAHEITKWMDGNYKLTPKKEWYGIDLDAKIADLRQQLAIAYAMKKRLGPQVKRPNDKEMELFPNPKEIHRTT